MRSKINKFLTNFLDVFLLKKVRIFGDANDVRSGQIAHVFALDIKNTTAKYCREIVARL